MSPSHTAAHSTRRGASTSRRVETAFYSQGTMRLARQLLGTVLVRALPDGTRLSGIVVEVEAYLGAGDTASHSFRGPGKKNASMFQASGTLYVYPIHSRHCLNIVSEPEGVGAAVLIRALEPLEGLPAMVAHRGTAGNPHPASDPLVWKQAIALTSGPGRLCQALDVDRRLDGIDLSQSDQMWLESPPPLVTDVKWKRRRTPRIGISSACDLQLRYLVDGHRFVSGRSRDHSRGKHWTFGSWQ